MYNVKRHDPSVHAEGTLAPQVKSSEYRLILAIFEMEIQISHAHPMLSCLEFGYLSIHRIYQTPMMMMMIQVNTLPVPKERTAHQTSNSLINFDHFQLHDIIIILL